MVIVDGTSLRQRSPTFWHQGPVLWKTIFPQTGGSGDGSGGNVSDGERQMKLRSLACRSPLVVRPGSRVRDPWFKR